MLLFGVLLTGCVLGAKPEINMRLQYPQQNRDVILTDVADGEIVFRPMGRDTGGRAYLEMDELVAQRGVLNFLFPQAFYDAIEELEGGNALKALPVIRTHAQPFTEYMELSLLPGNLVPTVVSYMDALIESEKWSEASEMAESLPVELAPDVIIERLGRLCLALDESGADKELEVVHAHILASRGLSDEQLAPLLATANEWRERANFVKAFDLYRKVQAYEGPYQTRARLWVAYSGFYLGQDLAPEVFLENLPEMDVSTPGYSLRELIKARLRLRESDYAEAMRSAAQGKTYANSTDKWYPELLHTIALVYKHMDMKEASIAAHRELTISFPSSHWAEESKKALQELTSDVSVL